MSDPSNHHQPQHREKLVDLSTGKSVKTSEAVLNLKEMAQPLPADLNRLAAPSENSPATGLVSPVGGN